MATRRSDCGGDAPKRRATGSARPNASVQNTVFVIASKSQYERNSVIFPASSTS